MPFLSLLPIFKLLCFWNPSCRFPFIASVPFPSTSFCRQSFCTSEPRKCSFFPGPCSRWVSPSQMLVCFPLEQLLSLVVSGSGGLQCPRCEPQKCSLEQVYCHPKNQASLLRAELCNYNLTNTTFCSGMPGSRGRKGPAMGAEQQRPQPPLPLPVRSFSML